MSKSVPVTQCLRLTEDRSQHNRWLCVGDGCLWVMAVQLAVAEHSCSHSDAVFPTTTGSLERHCSLRDTAMNSCAIAQHVLRGTMTFGIFRLWTFSDLEFLRLWHPDIRSPSMGHSMTFNDIRRHSMTVYNRLWPFTIVSNRLQSLTIVNNR